MIKFYLDIGLNIMYYVIIFVKILVYGSLDNIGFCDIVNYWFGWFFKLLCFYIIEWGLFV